MYERPPGLCINPVPYTKKCIKYKTETRNVPKFNQRSRIAKVQA